MNTKHLAIAWVVCVIFAWVMIALVGAMITSEMGAPESSQELFSIAFRDPTTIMISLLFGSIAAPCCYCYTRES